MKQSRYLLTVGHVDPLWAQKLQRLRSDLALEEPKLFLLEKTVKVLLVGKHNCESLAYFLSP
jgi:hypothetical protein